MTKRPSGSEGDDAERELIRPRVELVAGELLRRHRAGQCTAPGSTAQIWIIPLLLALSSGILPFLVGFRGVRPRRQRDQRGTPLGQRLAEIVEALESPSECRTRGRRVWASFVEGSEFGVDVFFFENAHVQDEIGSLTCSTLEAPTEVVTLCEQPIEIDSTLGTEAEQEQIVHAFDFACVFTPR